MGKGLQDSQMRGELEGGGMIKVLAHGNQHLQEVCPKCGCLFEYSAEDVYEKKITVGLIAWDVITKVVKCPECGLEITIR